MNRSIVIRCFPVAVGLLIVSQSLTRAADLTLPIAGSDVVFAEHNGVLAVEAEHFYQQTLGSPRAWHITSSQSTPQASLDADPPHVGGASGGAYVEALPDTRKNHSDRLIHGENFSNQPGKMGVLHYKVRIDEPGRYYVWIRAYSTGAEDNGVHVGLDGQWPASGQRWQTVAKHGWHWDCKQRTQEVHTGVPLALFLDIDKPGEHELLISLREDGFEMDKVVLARSRDFRPQGLGPEVRPVSGAPPQAFPFVAASETAAQRPQTQTPVAQARQSIEPRKPDGDGTVQISGELKQWHKVSLSLDGPFAHERDQQPNPFTDRIMTVTFTHESGTPKYVVPGYFAADGDAANSGAESGTTWRAHLSPDKPGRWDYAVVMRSGKEIIHNPDAANGKAPDHEKRGSFNVLPTDKTGRDFRGKGRLRYVGKHHLQFAGSQEYFLKAGPDSPETLLAYADFDGTEPGRRRAPRPGEATPGQSLHRYEPHLRDWKPGDPVWKGERGKGLIGALNYLSGKGLNAFSFLPYNAGGDGDNIWPFVARGDKLHYDCSKLDQWGIVFDHATMLGLYLHFKLQENEMDDNRRGQQQSGGEVAEALDGGKLGLERKLYCRELIARFGHALALNWNLGEENTQSPQEQRDMARYLHDTDPYQHLIVVHTYPNQQDKVYPELLGEKSLLTGASLQNPWHTAHQRTLKWLRQSREAGRPWVVANDEQNPASLGVPPDPGYQGHDGIARVRANPNAPARSAGQPRAPSSDEMRGYNLHDIRKQCLWGTLMAGGAGVEYYFGYQLPQNDLVCEDFRSRDKSWDYCRIALDFFREHRIPLERMSCHDELVGNDQNSNSRYCLAAPGEIYLVYLPTGGTTDLDLGDEGKTRTVKWFNPRSGGPLHDGSVKQVKGPKASLGQPPADPDQDWLILVR